MSAVLTGDWVLAGHILRGMSQKLSGGLSLAIRREALLAEREIKKGIASGAPGGKAFKPLADLTLKKRRAQRFFGKKPLIRTGDLRNSIRTVAVGAEAFFVGVLRSAKGRNGQPLVNVAAVNEFGASMVIPVDKRGKNGRSVRDFFWALVRKGINQKPLKRDTKYLYVRVPPRPFLGPVFEQLQSGRQERMLGTIGHSLGLS